MKKFIIFLLIFNLLVTSSLVNAQQTRLVQSPTINSTSHSCRLSNSCKYAAKLNNDQLTVWDVKSGRIINTIRMENEYYKMLTLNNTAKDMWFSKNENLITVKFNKDSIFTYDFGVFPAKKSISTEKTSPYHNDGDVKGGWTTLKTKQKSVYSPDKSSKLVIVQLSDFVWNTYCVFNQDTVDLGLTHEFSYFYSEDSKFLFTNNTIVNLKRKEIVSTLKLREAIPPTGVNVISANRIYLATKDGLIEISKSKRKFIPTKNIVKQLSIHNKKHSICIVSDNNGIKILRINNNTDKIDREILTDLDIVSDFIISPDNNLIALSYIVENRFFYYKIYDIEQNKLLANVNSKGYALKPYVPFFGITNSNEIIYSSPLKDPKVTNDLTLKKTKYVLKRKKMTSFNTANDISEDGVYFAQTFIDQSAMTTAIFTSGNISNKKEKNRTLIININTQEVLFELPEGKYHFDTFDVYENKVVLYNKLSGKIQIFSTIEQKLIFESKPQLSEIQNIWFSPIINKLISIQDNGGVSFRDANTFEEVYSVVNFSESEFIITTPEKYYTSSNEGLNHFHFVDGTSIYPLEQFDLKFNRPDLVYKKMGETDEKLLQSYHQAYIKRLKKMGFTEDMLLDDFHLPKIKIENYDNLSTIHNKGSIGLKLKLEDTKYKLDRINVWVNDVAIYGINGISLRDKAIQYYSTTLTVNLAKGKNKVQVSVLNQAGAESYKETFEIECSVGKSTPDLYLITIGVSEFEQTDFNLTYAAKDAQDMTTLFEKSKAYKNIYSKTLLNQNVTKENVLALKSFLAKAGINDEVMIFIAGHGVLDASLDYYLATYDMDFRQPQNKGLAYDDLESLLDGIKPLKKTLIIDACHSGEIDKEEIELAQADVNEGDDIQFRAVGNSVKPKLGMQNTSELVKSLFTDLRKGSGATVISSAGGMEFAMEGDDWSNGLFTYCLIKGITSGDADLNNDGEIWLSEIQQYVAEQVTELSRGKQQPTSRIENQTVDFRVW